MNRFTMLSQSRAEIQIYDQIGKDWWTGEGVDAKSFSQSLAGLGSVSEIDVRINSPGGQVFEGHAIYNALKSHPAKINVYIDGIAASIASVIAMAGDTITMADNAAFMIHEPWSGVMGDAESMQKEASILDKLAETAAKVYADRTGNTPEAMRAAMRTETWYTAQEALVTGFCDFISPNKQIAASAFSLTDQKFNRIPKWVMQSYTAAAPKIEPGTVVSQAQSSSPQGKTMATGLEAPATNSTASRKELAEQLKKYRDAFGDKNGADWFQAGFDWSEAVEMHNTVLKDENSRLQTQLADMQKRLDSVKSEETTSPASFSESPETGNKPKAKNLAGGLQGRINLVGAN